MEAILSCVIMAVMLVPALSLIGATAKMRRSQPDQANGVMLARHLLSEIMQCRYSDPDSTEVGESRTSWDDVSDYNNFNEASPTYRSGTAIPGFTGWKRTVVVEYVNSTTPDTVVGTDQGLKRITVTVTSPTKRTYVVRGLRSSGGVQETKPSAAGTYSSWVDVSIDAGGAKAVSGTNMDNLIP